MDYSSAISSSSAWFAIALVFSIAAATKIVARSRRTTASDPLHSTPSPPPVVSAISLLRLLPSVFREGPEPAMRELHAKLGSAFTVSFLFGQKVTFLIGQEEVLSHFFRAPASEISRGNLFEFTVPMFGREVGYGVDRATRDEQLRIFVDALKPSKLRSHVDPMLREVKAYFSKWGEDGVVDLKHELEEVLMLISSRCLLGKEVREKMFDEFRTLFREIENGVNFVSVFFPYIPIPAHRRRDSALVDINKALSEIVKSRRKFGGTEEDMLQRLIDSKYTNGRSMNEAEITGMIMTLLFAGKLTSAHTSTWTGACVLSSTKCLAAAVEEQKKIISKYNDQVDYSTLLEMSTLHNCIKEALRMHPSAPMLVRKAHKHFTVFTKQGNEYDIPKGHTLAIPVTLNNSMPHIYKDPEVYDPDRFSPDRAEDKVGGKFSFTSFGGGGNHGCFGEAYAYMQIKIIWSHLLRNFDLKLMSPFPKPDWSKFVLLPQGKVMVSYQRRHLLR
ncbi:unnamed protein product [Alopecurus aequalis]